MENMRKWRKSSEKSWEQLEKEHIRDYAELYGRVELVIGDGENENRDEDYEELPTDMRLNRIRSLMAADGSGQRKDGEGALYDSGLYSLLFQYGRYLMISSSRPVHRESQPANLQGIWCEDVRPVWSSNWTCLLYTSWMSISLYLLRCQY